MVMRQSATQHPVAWRPEEQRPFSLFTSDITWTDVNVSIDVRLAAPVDSALLGVRANPNCCGRVITGEDLMPGAWLWWDSSGAWTLFNAIANVTTTSGILANGTWPARPQVGQWHTVRLELQAGVLTGFLDGQLALQVHVADSSIPTEGFVGLGTGDWNQFVTFDNFFVKRI